MIIRQATVKDIAAIESILLDAVKWMRMKNIENLWNENTITWNHMSKSYDIKQFYIGYCDAEPVGCMALTDYDETYWPDIKKGESIYLHKLAIKRCFAGQGASKSFIDYAKQYAREKGCNTVRLDCNRERQKLRQIYEKQDFTYVKDVMTKDKYFLALYECRL